MSDAPDDILGPEWIVAAPNPARAQPLENVRLFGVLGTWMEEDVVGACIANAFAQGCERVYLVDNDSPDDTVREALAAGALLADRYRTESYQELTRLEHMNAAVERISLAEPDAHLWWLFLDADEFPHGSRGRTVREQLTTLDRKFRVVGARYFNHYPDRRPAFRRGAHPLELQPLCAEFPHPMCPSGHRKHVLQRFDRQGPLIRCSGGFHYAFCRAQLYEPDQPVFVHHFPFREEAQTRRRLEALYRGSAQQPPRARPGDDAAEDMRGRFESLEAVYAGDWQRVLNFAGGAGQRGVTLAPWSAQVDAADARVKRWE